MPEHAAATPEYADQAQQACSACHRAPEGGGDLTWVGEAFVRAGYVWPGTAGSRSAPSSSRRWLRRGAGFVHLSAAVVWLGTIFYVHLILRPQYAMGGLPKGEVRLAWLCMLALAVSGVPLAMLRFPRWADLTSTFPGQVMLAKFGVFAFLVSSAAFVTLCLGPRLRRARSDWQQDDGREGRPARVRVGERVYDVSGSPRWQGGAHFRRHQAGQDLSEALAGAPHGPEKLEKFPSVDAEAGDSSGSAGRVFYAVAYVNLGAALAIVVILTLYRWG